MDPAGYAEPEAAALDEDRGFGTAEDMLAFVGASRSIAMRHIQVSSGKPPIDVVVEVAYNPPTDDLWAGWWLEDISRGRDVRLYLIVPVTLRIRSSDGLLSETWPDAALIRAEATRVVLQYRHRGPLHGSADYAAFSGTEGAVCAPLELQLDFRAHETRADLRFAQGCDGWQTDPPPVDWRSVGPPAVVP